MTRRESIPATLLADVKNYLGITWSDEDTDKKVRGLIASGEVYLDTKRGAPADYEEDGLPRTLLLDYCRYMRDNALDVFESNYKALLLTMRHERLVVDYVEDALPC